MKFEQHLNGMIELRLPADRTDEILQKLPEEGIQLYQIRQKESYLYISIHLDDFRAVQQIMREKRCRFHIEKKMGIPFAISRIRRRHGLWLGCCTGMAMLYLLLSFLWGYEVSGNVYYSQEHMVALVQEYGMVPGARMNKFDYDALAQQIVLDHPEFTWIQLEPQGTTLKITVKERLQDDRHIEKTGSLVASSDGRITELLVFRGTALVKQGDWVTEGQVLVGGWDYPDRIRNEQGIFVPYGQAFAVEAQAVISGEQERSAIGSCMLKEKTLVSTGRQQKQIVISSGKHDITLYGPEESPYRYSSRETEQRPLIPWKGVVQIPIYIKTTVFKEKEIKLSEYSGNEAYEVAVKRAKKQLQEQMPAGSRFLHESIGLKMTDNPELVQAEVVWLVEENIARMSQIPLPETEQQESINGDQN